jgi:hypothetical protein
MSAETLDAVAESDLFSTVVHELGHDAVCSEFNLQPQVFIAAAGAGACTHNGTDSPQKYAVVSIAGILAEDVFGRRISTRKSPAVALPLRSRDLFQWFRILESNSDFLLSNSDRVGWSLCPEYRTVVRAFDILESNRDVIEFFAPKAVAAARDRARRLRGDARGQQQALAAFASGQMLDWLADEKARP